MYKLIDDRWILPRTDRLPGRIQRLDTFSKPDAFLTFSELRRNTPLIFFVAILVLLKYFRLRTAILPVLFDARGVFTGLRPR